MKNKGKNKLKEKGIINSIINKINVNEDVVSKLEFMRGVLITIIIPVYAWMLGKIKDNYCKIIIGVVLVLVALLIWYALNKLITSIKIEIRSDEMKIKK